MLVHQYLAAPFDRAVRPDPLFDQYLQFDQYGSTAASGSDDLQQTPLYSRRPFLTNFRNIRNLTSIIPMFDPCNPPPAATT